MAPIVEIDVYSAVVRENEVSNRICTLDVMLVACECGQKPGIFLLDELCGFLVCPEDVLVVWMEVYAGLLGGDPVFRYRRVYVGLVNDLGDDRGTAFEERGVGSGEFAAVDGVEGGVFDEQGEEGGDAVQGEEDEGDEEHDEDGDGAAHGDCEEVDSQKRELLEESSGRGEVEAASRAIFREQAVKVLSQTNTSNHDHR